MYFEKIDDILKIASKRGATIFVFPKSIDFNIPGSIVVKPEKNSTITIEQIRELILDLSLREKEDKYVVFRFADDLGIEASNAFLKIMEEPNEKIHFILLTDAPSKLLPTIISRAEIFFLRQGNTISSSIDVDEKTKEIAKKLLVVRGNDLVSLAEEISKKKPNPRSFALDVVGASIEILYKSYFLTNKDVFLKKIPKFLELYDCLLKNGHLKLQIVANLS